MATFSKDEIKILGHSAPIMLKMLRAKETLVLRRMHGNYKNGKTDFLADVAEFSVVREQIDEIERTLKLADGEPNQGE